jgi:hypothetical protein
MKTKLVLAMLDHFRMDLVQAIAELESELPKDMATKHVSILGEELFDFEATESLWRVAIKMEQFIDSAKG